MQARGCGLPALRRTVEAPRVSVFDAKVETLSYSEQQRILEIRFKNGQAWQLFGVPPATYAELRDTTISSFLRFIAQKYKAAPVKTGLKAIKVPEFEKCQKCGHNMTVKHRIDSQFDINIRILWECSGCYDTQWRQYGNGLARERKGRWH